MKLQIAQVAVTANMEERGNKFESVLNLRLNSPTT